MTRTTKRELEQRVAELREDADRGGFHAFYTTYTSGGEDQERNGYYEWDAELEYYVNEHGRTMTREDAPESDFEFEIEYE